MNDDAIHLDHEKLHVYRCAVEFLRLAFRIVAGLPRGEAELRSQLKRAAMSIPLNIAEVAPGKPGRRKHELRSKCESPRKDPAGNQPRAGRLVSTGKRVLRGLGATRAAKRRQRASWAVRFSPERWGRGGRRCLQSGRRHRSRRRPWRRRLLRGPSEHGTRARVLQEPGRSTSLHTKGRKGNRVTSPRPAVRRARARRGAKREYA